MANKEEIDKAIGAHGMWKSRLKETMETGKTEVPVETIKTDNQCAFGKWLYGNSLTPVDKTSANYKTVKELHAEFHKVAAKVAGLAISGNKADAEKLMSINGGEYAAISAKLTSAMLEWKKNL